MGNVAELYEHIKRDIERLEKASKDEESEKLRKLLPLRMKSYRLHHKLTQDGLAEKLCVSRMQIIRWEDGRHAPGGMAQKILRELGIIK